MGFKNKTLEKNNDLENIKLASIFSQLDDKVDKTEIVTLDDANQKLSHSQYRNYFDNYYYRSDFDYDSIPIIILSIFALVFISLFTLLLKFPILFLIALFIYVSTSENHALKNTFKNTFYKRENFNQRFKNFKDYQKYIKRNKIIDSKYEYLIEDIDNKELLTYSLYRVIVQENHNKIQLVLVKLNPTLLDYQVTELKRFELDEELDILDKKVELEQEAKELEQEAKLKYEDNILYLEKRNVDKYSDLRKVIDVKIEKII